MAGVDKQSKKQLMTAYKERKVVGGVYAIVNSVTGRRLIEATCDMAGSRNRFGFAQNTGTVISRLVQEDVRAHGLGAFSFEVLEEIQKKPDQTPAEFKEDVQTLCELWKEKYDRAQLYG